MRQPLTEKDIKEIRYECRMGYVLPAMFLILFDIIFFVAITLKEKELDFYLISLIAVGINLIPFGLSYLMNGKYLADIRNGEKEGETKTIQLKEKKKDYEAGSGSLYIGQEMKEFIHYDIVVENTRYQIDEEFYNNCNVDDEVVFYSAPKSRYLIEIGLKNNTSIAYSSFYD